MARGTVAKEQVVNKILEVFPGAFAVDKEIRIPIEDPDSGLVQIKISCTCAAKNIEPPDGSEIVPANLSNTTASETKATGTFNKSSTPKIAEPSAEEKNRVDDFLAKLGII